MLQTPSSTVLFDLVVCEASNQSDWPVPGRDWSSSCLWGKGSMFITNLSQRHVSGKTWIGYIGWIAQHDVVQTIEKYKSEVLKRLPASQPQSEAQLAALLNARQDPEMRGRASGVLYNIVWATQRKPAVSRVRRVSVATGTYQAQDILVDNSVQYRWWKNSQTTTWDV